MYLHWRKLMELSIQKWGNSAAVRLPAALLRQLGVAPGDKLHAEMQQEALVLRPARKQYSLSELMAQCDLSAPAPAEIAEWEGGRAVGNEIW
jgi:antitoxin ChpS